MSGAPEGSIGPPGEMPPLRRDGGFLATVAGVFPVTLANVGAAGASTKAHNGLQLL